MKAPELFIIRRLRYLLLVSLAILPISILAHATASSATCQLNSSTGAIQHVIMLQFDNVHFRRDTPNVKSDIEQIPNLYNFLVDSGTVLTNHHTPLIAHTGTDILTTLTGVYPDRHGQPVSNSYLFYSPDGTPHAALTFAYWTDRAQAFDGTLDGNAPGTFNLVTAAGKNAPAPWVPFTRAGCNVGGVGTANIELERTTNVATVYGAGSPEATEAADTSSAGTAKTTGDFIGIAIHCAKGASLCASSNHGQPDTLPDEPQGYSGFSGLFGHKYVAPQISPGGPLIDLDGNVIVNTDNGPFPGFPGFNGMKAAVSLAYVAAMQEHGVPVTYAYLSAVHEQNDIGLGPGDPTYEMNLHNYDEAFGKFFARLAADGINKSNTLFVVTADENDHFVGAGPLNPGCDGVTVPCHYDPSMLGNIEVAIDTILAQQNPPITTGFGVHDDSAPAYYLNGNPGQADPITRAFERGVGAINVTSPLTGNTEKLTNDMVDQVGQKILHMVTSDANRTPTFIQFEKPDYHGLQAPLDCSNTATVMLCPGVEVWNHGDLSPDVNVTWLGLVGPGVNHNGIDPTTWSDHTDTRPTILSLVGLQDDYEHQGRVLLELLSTQALSHSLQAQRDTLVELAQVYKQLNATVGQFGLDAVKVSTAALESNSSGDRNYADLEHQLTVLASQRDSIAEQMLKQLEAAAFSGQTVSEGGVESLIGRGKDLLDRVHELASGEDSSD